MYKVSIHVPARGTTILELLEPFKTCLVSIHVPARGTTVYANSGAGTYEFQSTFPQGERRQLLWALPDLTHVTIHVPAWGTTGAKRLFLDAKEVSIHVPARGTTLALRLGGGEF